MVVLMELQSSERSTEPHIQGGSHTGLPVGTVSWAVDPGTCT